MGVLGKYQELNEMERVADEFNQHRLFSTFIGCYNHALDLAAEEESMNDMAYQVRERQLLSTFLAHWRDGVEKQQYQRFMEQVADSFRMKILL